MSDEMPRWIAARLTRYLPKGARRQGDWIGLDIGEAVDGNEYVLYDIRADHDAGIRKALADELRDSEMGYIHDSSNEAWQRLCWAISAARAYLSQPEAE